MIVFVKLAISKMVLILVPLVVINVLLAQLQVLIVTLV